MRQRRATPVLPERPAVDGFKPGFRAGLIFALLAPVALGMVLVVVLYALDLIVTAADPWKMFGPSARLDTRPFAEAAERHWLVWLKRLLPAALCAGC